MLADASVFPTLPTTDLERARHFYGETLGLNEADIGVEGGVFYRAGAGTMLRVYERPPSTAEHTVAVFLVEDLALEMAELRRRGAAFEEYDFPHLTTVDGVYEDEQSGFKGSWIKDPDGNVLGITEILEP